MLSIINTDENKSAPTKVTVSKLQVKFSPIK